MQATSLPAIVSAGGPGPPLLAYLQLSGAVRRGPAGGRGSVSPGALDRPPEAALSRAPGKAPAQRPDAGTVALRGCHLFLNRGCFSHPSASRPLQITVPSPKTKPVLSARGGRFQ